MQNAGSCTTHSVLSHTYPLCSSFGVADDMTCCSHIRRLVLELLVLEADSVAVHMYSELGVRWLFGLSMMHLFVG